MPSLLDWTADPDASPALLDLATITRRAFPVGALPWPAIARDLERLYGVRYERRKGFSALGAPVSDYEAARYASLVLADAADALHTHKLPSELWRDAAASEEAALDRTQHEAHAAIDDYETAEELAAFLGIGPQARLNHAAGRDHSAETLEADRHALRLGDRYKDHAEALRKTARDVRASVTAQKRALQRLREELLPPADDVAPARAEQAARRFLAKAAYASDGRPLRRSKLARDYLAAGSPGALSKPDLFALATELWGAPRPLKGNYVYRPTS